VDLAAFAGLRDAFFGVQFTGRLGRIAAPTLVLPGAGHAARLESPAAFQEAVLEFLDSVDYALLRNG
jgi:pimeloyl-ACP methyl ester carboxylesterase